MARLRGPDGCPWDRAQTYDTVKGLLLEEAYEVVDAVNARDFDALEDELGDMLFQVVFYSQLAVEENRFDIDDLVERVHAKLVRRHPHVFGEVPARTPEEALKSWNAVKEKERQANRRSDGHAGRPPEELQGTTDNEPRTPPAGSVTEARPGVGAESLLDGISRSLPSTLEAYELGVRASEAGFDWRKTEDLLDKIQEELDELRQELPRRGGGHSPRTEEELGDLLFALANLARKIGSDPESCLRRANRKFIKRFQILEQEARKQRKKVEDCTPEELDRFWNAAKGAEM